MVATAHNAFEPPENPDVRIWRYMDFPKFVSLLESRGVHFARADRLGDPYEGTLGDMNYRDAPIGVSEQMAEKVKILRSKSADDTRKHSYVSCWHMNEGESAAMWQLYARTNEAISIQSTYEKFRCALPEGTYIGKVNYIDYRTEWMPHGNAFYPLLHKRRSFSHERELRAIRLDYSDRIDIKDADPDRTERLSELNRSVLLVDIDLDTFIEGIYVAPTAPHWFSELVEQVLERYKLNIGVKTSEIDDPPNL